jgi:periplasmic protein TonB
MTATLPSLGPLSSSPRPAALVFIVTLHLLLGAALLSQRLVEQVANAAPLHVQLLSPSRTPTPPAPEPLPVHRAPPAAPQVAWVPVPEVTLVAPPVAPSITPAPAQPSPPPLTDAVAKVAPPSQTPAPPAASAPPQVLPPSAVQYLVLPDVVYPSASRRLNETGLVIVAVWVDPDGLPQQVQLAQSSGYERLDRAALEGVRRARFKPWVLNGRATAGWARIPIPFELSS